MLSIKKKVFLLFFSGVSFLSQPLLTQKPSEDRAVLSPTPPQLHCLKLPWEISLQHELTTRQGGQIPCA